MPAVPVLRPVANVSRVPGWLSHPTAAVEMVVALVVAVLIVGLRVWTATHLPTYVWTRDSGSYITSATEWLRTGQWVTSARRGPVYSLFMAAIFRAGGTLITVATVQAVIGACTSLLTLLMARAWLGRRALWPLACCACLYALYGMPIELERLIRNETLLTLFATLTFGAWCFALRTGSAGWFTLSGLATGLMHLLKGIFPIFPVLVIVLTGWTWRRQPARALKLAACYLLLFALPLATSKLYNRLSGTTRPAEPEAGEMFYGRTAQWTVLDGGIVPEIKRRIHDQAAAYADRYRRTGKLDNNEIVKRTVVPSLKTILVDEGHGQLTDVDHLCWRLGLEAVAHHPFAYLKQVIHDLYYLNFITAQRFIVFLPHQLQSAGHDAEAFLTGRPPEDQAISARLFDLPASRAAIHEATKPTSGLERFARFITKIGRLRVLSPVFLTTLLLPLLCSLTRGRERRFWIGNVVLWYYYLALLSTVGRPLDRYLMPVLPIMFWTISTALCIGWRWALRRMVARHRPPSVATS